MTQLEHLALQAQALCRAKGWSRDWERAGVKLHLESSEFIEALRGKRGNPVVEAGDVLFVLLSMVVGNGIRVEDVVASFERKVAETYDLRYEGPNEVVRCD